MANAPLHKCNTAGCNQLTRQSRCERHAKERTAKNRPGDPFYCSTKWRKLRDRFLDENPLCVDCEAAGITEPAREVDHVIPRRERPDLELDWDNLAGRCKPHHSQKTRREQNARRR